MAWGGTGGQLPLTDVGFSCVALQETVVLVPAHCHDRGAPPATDTGVAVPTAHKPAALTAAAFAKAPPSANPQTPFLFCVVAATLALQSFASDHPFAPRHSHDHPPGPLTAEGFGVPDAHRPAALQAAAFVNELPLAGPHTPFTLNPAPLFAEQYAGFGAVGLRHAHL